MCTGLVISFQTLEMSCLWWTVSSQFFLWKYQMKKKYHPHIIWKFQANWVSMASATDSNVIQGQSLKSHFVPIRVLTLLIQSFFFKDLHYLCKIKRLFIKSIQLQHDLIQAMKLLILITKEHFFKNSQNSVSIGPTLKLS